jgi:hypothetical protein
MAQCPACSIEVAEGSKFCPACGAVVDRTSAPTQTSFEAVDGPTEPSPESRFIPGTVVAKRYRIVGLLGRGGMGEVYRADDLKLGQPVALKFLPMAMSHDPERLNRFLNEVRTALKVTHPNICRVYDIGEVDGQHYLSMEYVDGEDLASLLRRIGRLPQDKAVQIARQLCAGLAAAHEQGILHRDLKPANVMIDGRGRAKITDFGLAGFAEGIEGAEVRAGTPQYMSPEQHAGKEVTTRSDIYSLGLLLYELCTGKRAYEGTSAAEIKKLQELSMPTSPSSHVEGLDPAVERIILSCMETDPGQRPASALAVAASLPGGDPLAAALAAGETPSPEMVAAAGEQGTLKPVVGVACLVAVLVLFVAIIFLRQPLGLLGYVSMEKHPEALAEKARQITADLGLETEAANSAHGFANTLYAKYVEMQDQSPDRWEALRKSRPAALHFWYRQTNGPLTPTGPSLITTLRDPMQRYGESVNIELDMEGRLAYLNAMPPGWRDPEREAKEVDWSKLFEAAGLDPEDFEPAEVLRNPAEYCDTLAAWEGAYPERPEIPIRIQACAYRGTPTYFRSFGPWMETRERMYGLLEKPWTRIISDLMWGIMPLLMGVAALVMGIRNLRLGRGDRRSATRVALAITACAFLPWLLSLDSFRGKEELQRFQLTLAFSVLSGALAWVFYVALEPFVRRHWPSTLVSWSRLLSGRLRDALIGRDILVGILFGLCFKLLDCIDRMMGSWLGISPPRLIYSNYPGNDFLGFGRMTAYFLGQFVEFMLLIMGVLLGLALLRAVLRNKWTAVVLALIVLVVWGIGELSDPPILSVALNGLMFATVLFCMLRFGLLSVIAGSAAAVLATFPMTFDLSAWYAPATFYAFVGIVALATYGFILSLPRGRRGLASSTPPAL